MNSKIKILFMGTPEIATTILSGILDEYQISTVVTQPDKAVGRHSDIQKSPVKQLAEKNDIPVFQPNTKLELENYIKSQKPDLLIVAAFGMIVTKKTLEVPKYGAINVHPSLLPKYRGPWPIGAPILTGDKKTGTTIMLMNEKMDEGDILSQKEFTLAGTETTSDLTEKLANISTELLLDTLPKWLSGKIKPVKQNNNEASYTKMAQKEDGKIDWSKHTAEEIERMSRAYDPWPGIYTFWNKKKLDLFDISVCEGQSLAPGEIKVKENQLFIGTKRGTISPRCIKIEGKNQCEMPAFLCGYPDFLKSSLK